MSIWFCKQHQLCDKLEPRYVVMAVLDQLGVLFLYCTLSLLASPTNLNQVKLNQVDMEEGILKFLLALTTSLGSSIQVDPDILMEMWVYLILIVINFISVYLVTAGYNGCF
jgi:hypothetical protein